MNYKVGDEIIITKPSLKELKGWFYYWIKSMDDYIGKKYEINLIHNDGFNIVGTDFIFPLCILENNPNTNYEVY